MSYERLNLKNGQTLTAEHISHMEDGIASPDWDDMKNAPFGVTTEMVEILPEQSVTGTILQGNEGEFEFYLTTTPPPEIASLKLKENANYKVVFNGKEYICKTELWEQDFTGDGVADVKGYQLSTGSIPKGDVGFTISRGWPVIGGQTEDDVDTQVQWSIDNGETITLAIYEEQEIATKIDPKFLPDKIVIVHKESEGTVTCNMTLNDFARLTEDARFALTGHVVWGDNPYDLYFFPVNRVTYYDSEGVIIEDPSEIARVAVECERSFFEITQNGISVGVPT